ncbi:thioredoxin domain-containing protein [Modicisalibacter luteus]|uniref:Thioredoxin domain-containing protein n=1 Tax=Modicisalibacter luteus TaxID=453962 RepID=A0ABV7M547_9GAMM|nr:hypothetical protein [Halomonas lutea]GHA88132.1 hypothetical protein GCM10007159_06930 [Halomonas lutea]
MSLIAIALTLAWFIIILLAVVLFALARQIGLLHERMPGVGAMVADNGPQAGDPIPFYEVEDWRSSERVVLGQIPKGTRGTLLLFVAEGCPLCKRIAPLAGTFSQQERLELVVVSDEEHSIARSLFSRLSGLPGRFINDSRVGRGMQVGKVPYAVLVGPEGTLQAKGLVNSREHLESLVIARDSGVKSLQDYLGNEATAPIDAVDATAGPKQSHA